MTWQEELRKLDEELAAGRLAADDYRVRRDQVLSSAVTTSDPGAGRNQQAPAQQPQQQPAYPAAQPQHPGNGAPQQQYAPQQQQPQQQPQRQYQPQSPAQGAPAQAKAQGGEDATSTQIIAPVSPPRGFPASGEGSSSAERTQAVPVHDNSAERTQAVPSWVTQPPSNDPERTQVVPGRPGQNQGNQQHQAPGFAQQQGYRPQQPWNAPESDAAPPWGGSDFPPVAAQGSSDWIKQGPETFGANGGKSKRGVLVIVGVVVLAVLAVLVWLLFLRGGDNQTQQQDPPTTGQPVPTTSAAPPTPKTADELLPVPPGQTGQNNGSITLDQATNAKLLSSAEAKLLKEAGITKITHKSSKDGDFTYDSMVFEPADQNTAAKLKQSLAGSQISAGYVPGATGLLDKSKVVVHQLVRPKVSGSYRVLYVSGNRVVRLVIGQQPFGADDKPLIAKVQEYGPTVAEALPPS